MPPRFARDAQLKQVPTTAGGDARGRVRDVEGLPPKPPASSGGIVGRATMDFKVLSQNARCIPGNFIESTICVMQKENLQ